MFSPCPPVIIDRFKGLSNSNEFGGLKVAKYCKAGLLSVFILLFFSGCTTWPETLPPKVYFEETGLETIAADDPKKNSKMREYLKWVKRFYLGSIIYPLGWNDMTDQVLQSLSQPDQKAEAQRRLNDLGMAIVADWARSNKQRSITSSNVAVWGSALRTAAEKNQQLAFIERVEKDVDALLAGQLRARDITSARYYPPEDFDDF